MFLRSPATVESEPLLHGFLKTMVSLWILAAGAFAAAATALAVRRRRRGHDSAGASTASVGPVSEEWLSNARGQGDQSQ